jgi:hypothetical protein
MDVKRWPLTTIVVLILSGTSVGILNMPGINRLTLSKDKTGAVETSTFAPSDSIYARATVSNVVRKATIKFRLFTEDVVGQPGNSPVAQFDTTIELPGDGVGTYSLSPPTAGWPVGKYRIEVRLLSDSTEQKEQDAITFNVSR